MKDFASFKAKLSSEHDFFMKYKGKKNAAEIIEMARKDGFEITEEELLQSLEFTDEELSGIAAGLMGRGIAGGFSPFHGIIG